MSSATESVFALESDSPNRIAFDLERVMRTKYLIDDFQQPISSSTASKDFSKNTLWILRRFMDASERYPTSSPTK
jgi:phenylalanine-4-hydroxylase